MGSYSVQFIMISTGEKNMTNG